jgi:glycerol-3-phosphate acyltransferase PlsY
MMSIGGGLTGVADQCSGCNPALQMCAWPLDFGPTTHSNSNVFTDISLIAFGYLAGSVASAVIVCRFLGLPDPRSAGSRNPGATNVLRLHGRKPAALALAGDVGKGFLPVLLAALLGSGPWVTALTGVAAFAGHLYPVFFAFQGGRGVATLVGVLLGAQWLVGTAFIGTWLLIAATFRYSSLASLVAAALTPLYTWILGGGAEFVLCFGVMAAALLWRHRPNIRNLLSGTETKIGADSN